MATDNNPQEDMDSRLKVLMVCPECKEKYETDYKNKKIHEKGVAIQLPVSCKVCGYSCCYVCLSKRKLEHLTEGNKNKIHFDCKFCKEQGFNTDKPSINTFACDLMIAIMKRNNSVDNTDDRKRAAVVVDDQKSKSKKT